MSRYYDGGSVTVIDMKNKGTVWDEIAEQKGKGKKANRRKKVQIFEMTAHSICHIIL